MSNDDEVVTKNRDTQGSLRTTQSRIDYDVHATNLQNAIPDSGPAPKTHSQSKNIQDYETCM